MSSVAAMSPAPVTTEMEFMDALRVVLEDGKKVTRVEWANPQVAVFTAHLVDGDEYLAIRVADGSLHALKLRSVDYRATDWVVVREN